MWHWDGHMTGWAWISMLLFWGLIVLGIVFGIVFLWRTLNIGNAARGRDEHGALGDRPDRALEILRERYAKGEIDDEEFQRRKRDLDA
jgi:putative membrane protein